MCSSFPVRTVSDTIAAVMIKREKALPPKQGPSFKAPRLQACKYDLSTPNIAECQLQHCPPHSACLQMIPMLILRILKSHLVVCYNTRVRHSTGTQCSGCLDVRQSLCQSQPASILTYACAAPP